MVTIPLTVIVLARNEEANIAQCLMRVVGWADEVIVLDSGSTDRTMEISREMGATVVEHPFSGYVDQRNWALRDMLVRNEWVLFLDADEFPTEELKGEVGEVINNKQPASQELQRGEQTTDDSNVGKSNFPTLSFQNVDGFYVNRRFIWEGRWIRHGGYYPVWILRLMQRSAARCEGELMDEHFVVDGVTGKLGHDLVHDDRRGLEDWKAKHRRYAVLKAREYWDRRKKINEKRQTKNDKQATINQQTDKQTTGDREQKRRAGRRTWYDRLPLFLRAVLYFTYVFFVRGGIFDGPEGWRYHVLHALWYPLLIDREILRMRGK